MKLDLDKIKSHIILINQQSVKEQKSNNTDCARLLSDTSALLNEMLCNIDDLYLKIARINELAGHSKSKNIITQQFVEQIVALSSIDN